MQHPLLAGMLFLSGIALSSCQKEIAVTPNSVTANKPTSQDIQANYPGFDWDNPATITMPGATGKANPNLVSPLINVPWRSNGGTPLDAGIVNDYHKIDGWELVYNTFSPDNFPNAGNVGTIATTTWQPSGGFYFALYNRYKGLLRYYMYIPPGFFGSSTQISHGLGSYGNVPTKMLNFEGTTISDPNNSSIGFSKTSKDGVSATGGWYAMQYQIAYDPAFANTTFPNSGFKWDVYSTSISQISLNGVEKGSIAGTIVAPKPDFNWATAVLGVAQLAGTIAFNPENGFASAAAGGLSGSTQGVLDGLFGGPTTQSVSLDVSSNITTNGTITTFQPYALNSMPFPGQNVLDPNAVPPLINHSLGLFNLSSRPVVTARASISTPTNTTRGGVPSTYSRSYSVNTNAVRALFNQSLNSDVVNSDIIRGASITDFKAEVVAFAPSQQGWMYPNDTQWESNGGYTAFTGNYISLTKTGYGQVIPPAATSLGVRVSFHVVPNDPNYKSGPIFIVKTFQANVN